VNKLKAVVAAGLVAMAGVANANLLDNGSFEDNLQAPGTWQIYNSLTGWTGLPNVELRNGVEGTAQDGFNFVELDTTANSGIRQTFNIGAAGTYTLSFWFQGRPDRVATGDLDTYGLSFFISQVNSVSTVLAGSVLHLPNTTWTPYTASFTVLNPGMYSLRMFAIGTSDSFGTSVDNVAVVPEPGTVALMLAGLGVVGFLARRRGVVGGRPMPA
jgi:PEP-CTERM motif